MDRQQPSPVMRVSPSSFCINAKSNSVEDVANLGEMTRTEDDLYVQERLRDKSWVRLLQICPSEDGRGLRVTLKAYDLNDIPSFEALSYEWGAAGDTANLSVSGQQVTAPCSLQMFLTRLRENQHDPDTLYFADAVCIDQKNTSERSNQVALMGRIYRTAKVVHIWLGPDRNDIGSLFTFCSDLNKSATEAGVRSKFEEVFGPNNEAAFSTAAQGIFTCSYWRRLWITQEVLLARSRRIHCGQYTVTWDALWEGCQRILQGELWKSQTSPNSSFGGAEAIAAALPKDFADSRYEQLCLESTENRSTHPASLMQVITLHGLAECTNIRDRVFGLLGLMKEENRIRQFAVDYHDSPFLLFLRVMDWCRTEVDSQSITFCRHLREVLQLPFDSYEKEVVEVGHSGAGDRFGRLLDLKYKISVRWVGCIKEQIDPYTQKALPKILNGSDALSISMWTADGNNAHWFTLANTRSGDLIYSIDQSEGALIFRSTDHGIEVESRRKRVKSHYNTFVGRAVGQYIYSGPKYSSYDLSDIRSYLKSEPVFASEIETDCPLLERIRAPWASTVPLSELWALTAAFGNESSVDRSETWAPTDISPPRSAEPPIALSKCSRINPSTGKPCELEFTRSYDLIRHENTVHEQALVKVKCHICLKERGEEKTFSRADALSRHLKLVHPDVDLGGLRKRKKKRSVGQVAGA